MRAKNSRMLINSGKTTCLRWKRNLKSWLTMIKAHTSRSSKRPIFSWTKSQKPWRTTSRKSELPSRDSTSWRTTSYLKFSRRPVTHKLSSLILASASTASRRLNFRLRRTQSRSWVCGHLRVSTLLFQRASMRLVQLRTGSARSRQWWDSLSTTLPRAHSSSIHRMELKEMSGCLTMPPNQF